MLKSLELFGFKSFADKTRFDFDPGITGVVGPNGSGKSNVVDALKWILGDQSPKSLRGKEMTDVIFNGAAGRKASQFAEATITFDNATGFLAIDAAEVHIGRRLWRTGDSEYLINRAPARLKDVRDLLMGTGAGTAAYCIIEQGRVDQILQANPVSRRNVFEEAAGVGKFKSRRVEAQKKLERVQQNLLRLQDIVDEVESQLNSTRSQAAKAVKYRRIQEELKQWWLGFAADEQRDLSLRLAASEGELAMISGQLEEMQGEHRHWEEQERRFEQAAALLEDQLRDVDRRRAALRESIAGDDATIRSQAARASELEQEIARLARQTAIVRQRAKEGQRDLAALNDSVREAEDAAERFSRDWDARSRELESWTAQTAMRKELVDQARARRLELVRSVSEASHARANAQTRLAEFEAQRRALYDRAATLEQKLTEHLIDRDDRVAELERHLAEQQAYQQRLNSRQSTRRELLAQLDGARQQLSELREQRSAALARKGLLEDLELRQEGMGIGAKEMLARARTSTAAPWNAIIGSLAEMLSVDLENAAMLEVALGSRAQLIVLREYQAMVDYLHRADGSLTGRVGFIALPDQDDAGAEIITSSGRLLRLPSAGRTGADLRGRPGVIARADELVETAPEHRVLAEAVLADTWIVQSLDVAAQLAAGDGRGCRFVTPQGELVERDGSLHAGSIRSESAVVSRKSELRRLKQDLSQLERSIAECDGEQRSLQAALAGTDGELNESMVQLSLRSDAVVAAKSAVAEADQTIERLRAERAADAERAAELSQESAAQSRLCEASIAAARDVEIALEQAEAAVVQLEEQLARIDADWQTREREAASVKLQAAHAAERAESLKLQVRRLVDDRSQRQSQIEESDRRLSTAKEKFSQIVVSQLNASARVGEAALFDDALAMEALQLVQERAALREERQSLLAAEAVVRQQRRELADRQHALEIAVRDARHQQESLARRLEEDDQLTLDDVVQSGASAVRLWMDDRKKNLGRKPRDQEVDDGDDAETETDSSARSPIAAVSGTEGSTEASDAHSTSSVDMPAVSFAEIRADVDARVNRLRRRLKMLGHVNPESLQNLDQLEQRYQHLAAQLRDLVEAKQTLEDIIRRINQESKRLFIETFDSIRQHFQELFRKVFGGGQGDVILEDPDDVLECGIEIKARPPGKELRSLSLLSGGEKTMTAIALILAVFKTRPSPFCILDEVDAALDEANVERFTTIIKEMRQSTQIIMITHHKRSMVAADMLYGVTMEESGVSKRMSVRFDDVSDDGHFQTRKAA